MQKIRKIPTAAAEKTALPTNQPINTDFGLIWRPFGKYLQIMSFYHKSDSVTFLPL